MKNNYINLSILDNEEDIISDTTCMIVDWFNTNIKPINDCAYIKDNIIYSEDHSIKLKNITSIPEYIIFDKVYYISIYDSNIEDFTGCHIINKDTKRVFLRNCQLPNGFKYINHWVNLELMTLLDCNILSFSGICGNIDNICIIRSVILDHKIDDELYIGNIYNDSIQPNNDSFNQMPPSKAFTTTINYLNEK